MKLQFLYPEIMDVSFTLHEIEERDIEVAVQPGQDNIAVCTCTRFCLWETGRNACPHRSTWQLPSSTRNLKIVHEHSVCCRKILPKMMRYLSLLHFSHVEKFSYSSKQALYFINYLCFSLHPLCEVYKQFRAEPAQYGLEID